MTQTEKLITAAVVSALCGAVIGVASYRVIVASHQSVPWDRQFYISRAMRAGIGFAILLCCLQYRKIRSG
jgi:NhaP-type Na+/H+ or K+/H+ antiporter